MASTSEKKAQADPQAGQGCNPKGRLKAVQVVYEDDDGEIICAWVDLKKCNGFTWCQEDPPPRKNPPKSTPPFLRNEPQLPECTPYKAVGPDGDRDDTPICWWSGRGWECGM